MNNVKTTGEIDRHLVATIVSSYVKHKSIAANDVPALIASVHQSLSGLGRASPVEVRAPAVPVRRSVRHDYVVCLGCGLRSQTLRRHLRVQHGLEPAAYYARWSLPSDHPITAPAYSARRAAMAKELGFGLRRKSSQRHPASSFSTESADGGVGAIIDGVGSASSPLLFIPAEFPWLSQSHLAQRLPAVPSAAALGKV
jgi:predicted transcriptional regulator